ncbi:diaminopimelate epimerase [Elusimicrobium posterum]|uniref:diaminopimelate epimerase n=1 Tax=Elusimicrobium posterum TaxID=3116653 RepID=UPI003C7130DB
MRFEKWQGIGNDFVVINCTHSQLKDPAGAAVKMCDRHFGIGADGLVLIEKSDKCDFKMRIINSDGSEPEMCGNGLRCAAKYIKDSGLTEKNKFTIETLAGVMEPEILSNGEIKVNMGAPTLTPSKIPVALADTESNRNITIDIEGTKITGTAVSMGNPHFVIFTDNTDDATLHNLGPKIEKHTMFPRKTNVEFITILDRKNIRMRVWERGAAVTLACGTGACASTVACILEGKTENQITVHLDGGNLNIEWAGQSSPVFMTGAALKVFEGEYKW